MSVEKVRFPFAFRLLPLRFDRELYCQYRILSDVPWSSLNLPQFFVDDRPSDRDGVLDPHAEAGFERLIEQVFVR